MPNRLTPRQLEILNLMAKGLSNKEICQLLEISNNTVKIHVASVLRTLGVANRTEAVFAYQQLLAEEQQTTDAPGRMQLVDRLGRPAIAVLPFENLQAESGDEALTAGLVEELLVRLSAWHWFPVVAYGSSRRFDPKVDDPRQIGAELAARYLIYGSLRSANDLVRVTIRLVDTDLAQEFWSRSFDAPEAGLFNLQQDIATQIVMAMAPELSGVEAKISRRVSVDNGSAWQLFCKGMWLARQNSADDCLEALQLFNKAIELAPDFSLAWHGKVRVLMQQLFEQWVEDRDAAVAEIRACISEELRLDPGSGHALMDAGYGHVLQGRRELALDYLQRAVEANPSSPAILSMLAQAYGMAGRLDDAIMHLEEVLRVDPHAPSTARYRTIIAMCHAIAGRSREAIEFAKDAVARDPQAQGAYLAMIAAYVDLEDQESAQQAVHDCLQNNPDFDVAERIDMMRPFTEPELLDHLTGNLRAAGLNL